MVDFLLLFLFLAILPPPLLSQCCQIEANFQSKEIMIPITAGASGAAIHSQRIQPSNKDDCRNWKTQGVCIMDPFVFTKEHNDKQLLQMRCWEKEMLGERWRSEWGGRDKKREKKNIGKRYYNNLDNFDIKSSCWLIKFFFIHELNFYCRFYFLPSLLSVTAC